MCGGMSQRSLPAFDGRPIVVGNAVDAAAAMHRLLHGWARIKKSCITVDPESGCVSYQHEDCCKQAQFLAEPVNHFQKGCVYVWAPPPDSSGKSLVCDCLDRWRFFMKIIEIWEMQQCSLRTCQCRSMMTTQLNSKLWSSH